MTLVNGKVIINVIVKAITAPFSLLAGALGGGGEELSTVSFAAGSAQLAPAARAGLDEVAKALAACLGQGDGVTMAGKAHIFPGRAACSPLLPLLTRLTPAPRSSCTGRWPCLC